MLLENYYHILWLDITSSQKQISKRSKDILKYLAIGEIPDFDSDLASAWKYRNEIYVKSALDNLSDPKEKLLHAFFWFEIEDESDQQIFSLINEGKDEQVTKIIADSGNKKNLALIYSLFLLEPIDKHGYTYSAEDSIKLFKEIQDDDKFWRNFEKKYFLFDDISTNKELISDLRKNLGTHLSNLYYDISIALQDDSVLKIFHKYFKNTKGSKTVEKVEKIYIELHKLSEELKNMNISDDWVFDEYEKKELKRIHKNVKKSLKELKELWLYDDSKTLIVRDTVAESFRVIMLDLNNALDEENEALKVLNYALDIVGTDGLKHQIRDEYDTITSNLKFKPIIQSLGEEDFIAAYSDIVELEEDELSSQDSSNLNKLKRQAVFWILGDDFVAAKKVFEDWDKNKNAYELFSKVESFAEENIYLFDIEREGLNNIISNIRTYLQDLKTWKYESWDVFNYIDTIREGAIEKLWEMEWYFCIFYIDSISYGFLSEINSKPKGTQKPLFLFTLWGWGVSIYWDTTYFTGFWLPIAPINSWEVNDLWNGQYQFFWKKEMPWWKKIWRFIWWSAIILFVLTWLSEWSNSSSSSSYSNTNYSNSYNSNSNSYSNNTSSNQTEYSVWEYTCSNSNYNRAIELQPVDVWLDDKYNEITRLQNELKNTYVNEYSQSSVDSYNSKLAVVNGKIDSYDRALNIYNAAVDKYNNFLDDNCY